uniref:BPTI/Kunitz inhibitor domain-containing protein n=1 Tax=Loa loa TaxID=7209 RepID=A0A1I7VYU1_LOALO
CVNAVTGAVIHGSRSSRMKLLDSSLAFPYSVCSNKKTCSITCNDALCPSGFEMDANNCPKDLYCRCHNLCDAIQCSNNKVCMLRRKNCSESTCIPIPSCQFSFLAVCREWHSLGETNPCSDTRKPALDEITYIHLSCFENRTEMCPTEPVMMWPCKELATLELSNLGSCPQGNPFSNKVDGWPVNCTQFGNNCPSTHYCSSAPDQSFGVCYVSKRYVCRLPLDAGPCAVNLKRYYYDYTNKTCISFNYAGCSGNSNNFINKKDCEKFCLDISADLNGLLNSTDKVVEIYQLGFPSRDLCFMANINKIAFRHYLKKRFDVADDELRDIIIYDENVVQFVLRSEDAKLKAANISDLANDGSFRFTYNDNIYRTEPHSCSSHRIAEKKALCGKLLYGKRFVKKVNHHREAFLPLSMQSALAVQHRPSRQALRAMASKNGQCYRQTMSKGSDLYKVHTALQTPGGFSSAYRTALFLTLSSQLPVLAWLAARHGSCAASLRRLTVTVHRCNLLVVTWRGEGSDGVLVPLQHMHTTSGRSDRRFQLSPYQLWAHSVQRMFYRYWLVFLIICCNLPVFPLFSVPTAAVADTAKVCKICQRTGIVTHAVDDTLPSHIQKFFVSPQALIERAEKRIKEAIIFQHSQKILMERCLVRKSICLLGCAALVSASSGERRFKGEKSARNVSFKEITHLKNALKCLKGELVRTLSKHREFEKQALQWGFKVLSVKVRSFAEGGQNFSREQEAVQIVETRMYAKSIDTFTNNESTLEDDSLLSSQIWNKPLDLSVEGKIDSVNRELISSCSSSNSNLAKCATAPFNSLTGSILSKKGRTVGIQGSRTQRNLVLLSKLQGEGSRFTHRKFYRLQNFDHILHPRSGYKKWATSVGYPMFTLRGVRADAMTIGNNEGWEICGDVCKAKLCQRSDNYSSVQNAIV